MKKLKFKKLLNEYRSLSYELEYMKEAMVIANDQFETYYREYCRKNNISISDLETKNKPKVKQIFQKAAIDKKKIQEVMSKKIMITKESSRKLPEKSIPISYKAMIQGMRSTKLRSNRLPML